MNNEEKILEVLTQIQEEQKQMREDVQQIKGLATRTALIQENEIRPDINTLVEGQELTHQMIKELASKREVDELREQIEILRSVVALHSREIEELKKAQ